jgi:hypothetical protein
MKINNYFLILLFVMLSQNIYYCSASENSRSILNIILENLTKGGKYVFNSIRNNKIISLAAIVGAVGLGYLYNQHQKNKIERERLKKEEKEIEEKEIEEKEIEEKEIEEKKLLKENSNVSLEDLLTNFSSEKEKFIYYFSYNQEKKDLFFIKLDTENAIDSFNSKNDGNKINNLLIISNSNFVKFILSDFFSILNKIFKKLIQPNEYYEGKDDEVGMINEFIEQWNVRFKAKYLEK